MTTQKPTIEPGFMDGSTKETHPAYAQISASRGSGRAYLYGSEFEHQHFIEVRIKSSEVHRNLSRDWHFGRDEYISVWLSEAQWATMISSLNVGDGVPCTLTHVNGADVPMLPRPEQKKHKFAEEAIETVEGAINGLRSLITDIESLNMSKKARDGVISRINKAIAGFTSSLPFVAKQFSEHMETVTEHAKVEIEAYSNAAVLRRGLQALQDDIKLLERE